MVLSQKILNCLDLVKIGIRQCYVHAHFLIDIIISLYVLEDRGNVPGI